MNPHAGKVERRARALTGRTTKDNHAIECGTSSEPAWFVLDTMVSLGRTLH